MHSEKPVASDVFLHWSRLLFPTLPIKVVGTYLCTYGCHNYIDKNIIFVTEPLVKLKVQLQKSEIVDVSFLLKLTEIRNIKSVYSVTLNYNYIP